MNRRNAYVVLSFILLIFLLWSGAAHAMDLGSCTLTFSGSTQASPASDCISQIKSMQGAFEAHPIANAPDTQYCMNITSGTQADANGYCDRTSFTQQLSACSTLTAATYSLSACGVSTQPKDICCLQQKNPGTTDNSYQCNDVTTTATPYSCPSGYNVSLDGFCSQGTAPPYCSSGDVCCKTATGTYLWLPGGFCGPDSPFLPGSILTEDTKENCHAPTGMPPCPTASCQAITSTCTYTDSGGNQETLTVGTGEQKFLCHGDPYADLAACQDACPSPSACTPTTLPPPNDDSCQPFNTTYGCGQGYVCKNGKFVCTLDSGCQTSCSTTTKPDCGTYGGCPFNAICLASTWMCELASDAPASCKGTPVNKPECSDGIDNNHDGTCDYAGCYVTKDGKEVFLPPDPGCTSPADPVEANCQDGIKDGTETGVDCGGSCPNSCATDHCTIGGVSYGIGDCITSMQPNGFICQDVGGSPKIVADATCNTCSDVGKTYDPATGYCSSPSIDCSETCGGSNGQINPECFDQLCHEVTSGSWQDYNPFATDQNNPCSWQNDKANYSNYYCCNSPATAPDKDANGNYIPPYTQCGVQGNCMPGNYPGPFLNPVKYADKTDAFLLSWTAPASCQSDLQSYALYSCWKDYTPNKELEQNPNYCNPLTAKTDNAVQNLPKTTFLSSYPYTPSTPSKVYCFAVSARYADGSAVNSSIQCSVTPSPDCAGKLNTQTCEFNSTTKALTDECTCDSYGQLSCTSCPTDQYCSIDANNNFQCLSAGSCGSCNAPYSFFGNYKSSYMITPLQISPTQTKLQTVDCSASPYCIYTKNQTSVDYFTSCSAILDLGCYGYTTEAACEGYPGRPGWDSNNKCFKRDCAWIPTNPELGAGVCVETDPTYQKCGLCAVANAQDAALYGGSSTAKANLALHYLSLHNSTPLTICSDQVCGEFGPSCAPQDTNGDGFVQTVRTPSGTTQEEFCKSTSDLSCSYYVRGDAASTRAACLSGNKKAPASPYTDGTSAAYDIQYNAEHQPIGGSNVMLSKSNDQYGLGICSFYDNGGYFDCRNDLNGNGTYPASADDRYPPKATLASTHVKTLNFPVSAYDTDAEGQQCSPGTASCSGVSAIYGCAAPIDPSDASCFDYAGAMRCIASGGVYCRDSGATYLGACITDGSACSGTEYRSFSDVPTSSCYCYPDNPASNGELSLSSSSGNGMYYVYYYASDKAGNMEPVQSALVTLDTVGPDIMLDPTRTAPSGKGYIVQDGSYLSGPPHSNLTVFFNTSESATCSKAVLTLGTEHFDMQVYPSQGYDRQFYAMNDSSALPDGSYLLNITCNDAFGNGNMKQFSGIRIDADKRILGVFPDTAYPLNVTQFNLTAHTGYPLSCGYNVTLLDGRMVANSSLEPFSPLIGASDGTYYQTVRLNLIDLVTRRYGIYPAGQYIYHVNCSSPGILYPSEQTGSFSIDLGPPVTRPITSSGIDYNFSAWKQVHNNLEVSCTPSSPIVPGGYACGTLDYCFGIFPCTPNATASGPTADHPYATFSHETYIGTTPLSLVPGSIVAPRYFCYRSVKSGTTLNYTKDGAVVPFWMDGERFGYAADKVVCRKLLVDRTTPTATYLPSLAGNGPSAPLLVGKGPVTFILNASDYTYLSSSTRISSFLSSPKEDGNVHLDTPSAGANSGYAFANFTANFTFTLPSPTDPSVHLPSYLTFIVRAYNASDYYAVRLTGLSLSGTKLQLVYYDPATVHTADHFLVMKSSPAFTFRQVSSTVPLTLLVGARGSQMNATLLNQGTDGWKALAAVTTDSADALSSGVFGYGFAAKDATGNTATPFSASPTVRIQDLDEVPDFTAYLLNESQMLAAQNETNTTSLELTAGDLANDMLIHYSIILDDKAGNAVSRDAYLYRDTAPPAFASLYQSGYYYNSGGKWTFQATPKQVSDGNITLEQPSNVTLNLTGSATLASGLSQWLSNLSSANVTYTVSGVRHAYNLTYNSFRGGTGATFNVTIPSWDYPVGDYNLTFAIRDLSGNVARRNYTLRINDSIAPTVNLTVYKTEDRVTNVSSLFYRTYYVTLRSDKPLNVSTVLLNLTFKTPTQQQQGLPPILAAFESDRKLAAAINGTLIFPAGYERQHGLLSAHFTGADAHNNTAKALLPPAALYLNATGPGVPYFEPGFYDNERNRYLYNETYPSKLYRDFDRNFGGDAIGSTFVTNVSSLVFTGFAPGAANVTVVLDGKKTTIGVGNASVIATAGGAAVSSFGTDADGNGYLVIKPVLGNQSPVIGKYLALVATNSPYGTPPFLSNPRTTYGRFAELYPIAGFVQTSESTMLTLGEPLPQGVTTGMHIVVYNRSEPPYLFSYDAFLPHGRHTLSAYAEDGNNGFSVPTQSTYTIISAATKATLISVYPQAGWTVPTAFSGIRAAVNLNRPGPPLSSVHFLITVNGSLQYNGSGLVTKTLDHAGSTDYMLNLSPDRFAPGDAVPQGAWNVTMTANTSGGAVLMHSWRFTVLKGTDLDVVPVFYQDSGKPVDTSHDLHIANFTPAWTAQPRTPMSIDTTPDDYIYYSNTTHMGSFMLVVYHNDTAIRRLNLTITLSDATQAYPLDSIHYLGTLSPSLLLYNVSLLPVTFAQGNYTLNVTLQPNGTEFNYTYLRTLVVDTTPPALSNVSGTWTVRPDTDSYDLSFNYTDASSGSAYFTAINASGGAVGNLSDADSELAAAWPGMNSLSSLYVPPWPDGDYLLNVTAYDQAGNRANAGIPFRVRSKGPAFNVTFAPASPGQLLFTGDGWLATNASTLLANLTLLSAEDANHSQLCWTDDRNRPTCSYATLENRSTLLTIPLSYRQGATVQNSLTFSVRDDVGNTDNQSFLAGVDRAAPSVNLTVFSDWQRTANVSLLYFRPYYITLRSDVPVNTTLLKLNLSAPGKPSFGVDLDRHQAYAVLVNGSFSLPGAYIGYAGPLSATLTAVDVFGNTQTRAGGAPLYLDARGPPTPYFEPKFYSGEQGAYLYNVTYPGYLYRDYGIDPVGSTFVTNKPTLFFTGFAPKASNFTVLFDGHPTTMNVSGEGAIPISPTAMIADEGTDASGKSYIIFNGRLGNQSPVVGAYLEFSGMPRTTYGHFGELYPITGFLQSDSTMLTLGGPLPPASVIRKTVTIYSSSTPPYWFGYRTPVLTKGKHNITGYAMDANDTFHVGTSTYTLLYTPLSAGLKVVYPQRGWTVPTSFTDIHALINVARPAPPITGVAFRITVNGSLLFNGSGTVAASEDHLGSTDYLLSLPRPAFERNGTAPQGAWRVSITANTTLGEVLSDSWGFNVLNGTDLLPVPVFYGAGGKPLDTSHDLYITRFTPAWTATPSPQTTIDASRDDFVYYAGTTSLSSVVLVVYHADPALALSSVNLTLSRGAQSYPLDEVTTLGPLNPSILLYRANLSAIPFAEGNYTLNITLTPSDTAMNYTYVQTLVIDTTPPALSNLTGPAVVSPDSASFDLSFNMSDVSSGAGWFSVADAHNVPVGNLTDGSLPPAFLSPGRNDFYDLYVGPWADGHYLLTVSAYDQAGNKGTATLPFRISSVGPPFTLSFAPGAAGQMVFSSSRAGTTTVATNGNQLLANLTLLNINDAGQSSYCVTGLGLGACSYKPLATQSTTVPLTLSGQSGATVERNITFSVRDMVGNVINRTVSVSIDHAAPETNISGNLTYRSPLTVRTDEPATLSDITVQKSGGQAVPLSVVQDQPGTLFTLTNSVPLATGVYTLGFTAADRFNNTRRDTSYRFTYTVPPFTVNLTRPSYGWTSSQVFTIGVETSQPASGCRYDNRTYLHDIKDLAYSFTGGPLDFTASVPINITQFGPKVNVICEDSFGAHQTESVFTLTYDPLPVSILSATLSPNPVIEYLVPPANSSAAPTLFSLLNVTTDKPSLCAYGTTNASFPSLVPMLGIGSSHAAYIIRDEPFAFDISNGVPVVVSCRSLADVETAHRAYLNLSFNLAAALQISGVGPLYTQNIAAAAANITTNLYARCTLSNGSVTSASVFTSDANIFTLQHRTALSVLSGLPTADGYYTFPISCVTGDGKSASATLPVYYDRTAPVISNVTVPNVTCSNDEISGIRFHASDNVSGILQFNYSLYDSADPASPIVGWATTGGTSVTFRRRSDNTALNLTEGDSYFVKVYAENRAGKWTTTPFTSSSIIYNSAASACQYLYCGDGVCSPGESCSTCPKDCGTCSASCSDGVKDGNETGVDCGGPSCSPCGLNQTCISSSDCASGYCQENATGTMVCQPNVCKNGVYDPLYETDVDCGKTCPGCGVGGSCATDNDCAGDLYCTSDHVCAMPSCSDGVKNQDETGIDCGGKCALIGQTCALNDSCLSNSDCTSGYCNSDYLCATPSCTDGVKNGNETGIDCGGGTCPACALNETCVTDSDCASGFCNTTVSQCQVDMNKDSNHNGIPDWWETKYFGCPTCANASADPDGDGLSNYQEYLHQTSPLMADTDGDGYTDGQEILAGTNPLDPKSFPHKSSMLGTLLLILLILLVLGGGGYFGYDYYMKRKKKQTPLLMQNLKTLGSAMRRTFSPTAWNQRRPLSPLQRQRAAQRDRETAKILSSFGQKPAPPATGKVLPAEQAKKPAPAPQPAKKEAPPDDGWIDLSEKPKDTKDAQDPFSRLKSYITPKAKGSEKLDEKLGVPTSSAKAGDDPFGRLREMTKDGPAAKPGKKGDEDVFSRLKEASETPKKK